jgi:putative DNA primase/helicase
MLDWQPCARPWPADPTAAEADRERRIRLARDIWSQTRPAAGTVVETYLRHRGISIPIPPTLRYLPQGDCYAWHPWSGERRPVMVAAVEHVERGLVAVHRTWLQPDGGGKATISPERVTTGSVGGAAVRLAELIAVGLLAVAEGIESTLCAMELCGRPGWAALSSAGLKGLLLPAEAIDVIIFVDRDYGGVGERAARRAAGRWVGEGRKVQLVIPDRPGTDANDLLREVRYAS